jgi:hypothetical protein
MYINVFYCMFAVSFGNLHDDVQAEPRSWLVIGMIPVFDKKKATRGKGPTEDGPWYPCVYIHTCIYIHIHTHTYRYTHIHIHTYIKCMYMYVSCMYSNVSCMYLIVSNLVTDIGGCRPHGLPCGGALKQ